MGHWLNLVGRLDKYFKSLCKARQLELGLVQMGSGKANAKANLHQENPQIIKHALSKWILCEFLRALANEVEMAFWDYFCHTLLKRGVSRQ